MFVKICGLSDPETARFAVEQGADAIGIIMSAPSPRNVTQQVAQEIVQAVGSEAQAVLVVREMPVDIAVHTAKELGVAVLQLHGTYTGDEFRFATSRLPRVWRATSLTVSPDVQAGEFGEELVLLDGQRAGSGETWDVTQIQADRLGTRWLLAGGLTPDNVAESIRIANPWGVDVSSGVESAPGRKNRELITRFIAAARNARA